MRSMRLRIERRKPVCRGSTHVATHVQFADSLVRVPFRILTDEEKGMLSRNYGDIRRQVQDAFEKK